MGIRRLLVAALAGLLLAVPASASPRPHIVNGTPRATGDYPYVVALVVSWLDDAQAGLFCGGSLIAPTWVLTAGHCVDDNGGLIAPASVDAIVGRTDLTSTDGDRISVVGIYRYPGFSMANLRGDVALLQLARPPAPGVGAAVRLAAPGDGLLFAPGVVADVVGWGSTIPTGGGIPAILQGATIAIDAPVACSRYGTAFDPAVMLCAGDGTRGACFGDSGGPLVAPDGVGGVEQVGIVSYGGTNCLDPTSPDVFAEVAALRGFIDDFLAPRSPDLVELTPRPGVLHIAWQPHNGATAADSYLVTVEPGSVTFPVAGSDTEADLTGLPAGVPLTVSISATISGQALAATVADVHPTLPVPPSTTSFDVAVGPTGALRVVAGVDSSSLPTTFHAEYGRTQVALTSTPTLTVQYYGSLYEAHVILPETTVTSGDWWVRLVLTSIAGTGTTDWYHWYRAPVPPAVARAPRISGRPEAGARLRCLAGTWTSAGAVGYRFAWRSGPRAIAGAKGRWLTVPRRLAGHRVVCVVTATNADGATAAPSAAVLIRRLRAGR